ncbi:aminotransferase class V-fold PLP-dependent enzyme [Haloarchaeobius sp. HME9146]|uniref:aminotransferase class V-fold PLP-dependent enzyme n=1 Tax=Haloarchaeobius sp. HME9146 TaxID=2978732 RepID=UPI0021BE9566|nr:aminotransferase class V-fold PLP-dependent enzyme [Haloarchaeobius sp. HME9146]MCT9095997.1 aminotransferase class V-fold PLP-dependent enzyme [Haloarchaeobius sp. HME9146]
MHPSDLRDDMPVLDRTVYLNTGASGPSPRRVTDAVESWYEFHEFESPAGEGMYMPAFDLFDDVRETVAGHIGSRPEEVALTGSTTDGISRLPLAMDWDSDDVIVRTDAEHAAGILPWRRLRDEYGVEVRVVETDDGRIPREEWKEAVEGATLATFSSICWTSGVLAPVSDLVDIAHDAGARVLVDAVQSTGQHAFDVHEWGADAVAGSAHKWLLGPWGAGYLFVEQDFAETLEPAQLGYRNLEDPYADPYEYAPGAKRFEFGTVAPAPYAGLQEAIEMMEDIGMDTIEDHIADLTDYFKAELGEDRLVSPREYHSGLVSFSDPDPEATVEQVAEQGIKIRSIPTANVVRASLHVFNTRDDVDALLDAL